MGQQGDDKFRSYIIHSPDGVFVADGDGRYLEVNPAASKITGYSESELLRMAIPDLLHADSREAGLKHFQTLKETGTASGEMRFLPKDGTVRWWKVDAVKLSDERYLGFVKDVTEYKRAEESLLEAEWKFRALFEKGPIGVAYHEMIYDASGKAVDYRFLDANETYRRLTGIDPRGKTVLQAFPGIENDPFDWIGTFGHVARTGETVRFESYLQMNDRWYDCVGYQYKPDHFVAAFFEITDRKLAEKALARSEAKHGRMVANIGDVIVIIDADGINRYKSPNIERWFGWKPEEVVGQSAWDNVHPDDLADSQAFIGRLLREPNATGKNECRYRCKDGGYKWIEFTGVNLLHDPDIQGVLGNYRDISDRKKAEEERTKLQAQLLQAQKMESVGRLAGGVAHDFNNMLGVILGHAEMALESVGPGDPIHDDLVEIRSAGERSANITRQLLSFARKQMVVPRVVDPNEVVEGMLKMLRRLIGEEIDLAWTPEAGVWPINMDPSQIDQILANLCVNARDAISGVGRISVETGNVTVDDGFRAGQADCAPGDYVTISVSDDGCGMDKETIANIFDPFFTTKKVGEGTGLGLATVYGAVRQNNGFVGVYSEPGRGSTFKVYIPRFTGRSGVAGAAFPSESAVRGHETVLLVEDEPSIRTMVDRILSNLGYSVLSASTPGEAIRIAKDHPGRIDLLLTDVVMPEMNGRDLAAGVVASHPATKCLFMSGYTADVIANQGVLEDGVHFIEKPFSIRDLAAKVRETLGA